jgi:hypothetical protein
MDRETLVKLNGDVAQLKEALRAFGAALNEIIKPFAEFRRTLNLELQRRDEIMRGLFYSWVNEESFPIGRKRRRRRARGKRLVAMRELHRAFYE